MITKTINLYEGRDDVTLTAYVIAEKGQLNVLGKRPALLICPGGAYLGCSDREAEPVALKFAAMGYQAFVLRYSTYDEGKGFMEIDNFLTAKKHCIHPAPVRDIGKAMLVLKEYSAAWFVDMERVVICGFSAGAHNAAMFGCYWHQPLMTDFLQTTKESIRPAALILGYGLSDYVLMKEAIGAARKSGGADAQNMCDVSKAANMALFGEETPDDEKLRETSPARLVSERTPPAFIWATAGDRLVPVKQSIVMATALADNNIPFEIHIFEEGIHGLSLATQASALDISQIDGDAAKWIDLAECWLKKRFALRLPEQTER